MPADFLDYGKQFLIFAHPERSIGKHAKKEKIHHGFSLLLGHIKCSSIKGPNGIIEQEYEDSNTAFSSDAS